MQDLVLASLERVATHAEDVSRDIYRDIYDVFAGRCPGWAALMSHMDEHMLGRMMQDLLVLLMTPPGEIDQNYLGFEITSHRAYGVTAEMFPPMLESARDTVRRHLGDEWTADIEQAWNDKIAVLGAQISAVGADSDTGRTGLTSKARSAATEL